MTISNQSSPIEGRFFCRPHRAVAYELTRQFHARRDNVVVRDGFEQCLGIHDDASHVFLVSLPHEDVAREFFASPIEGIGYGS